MNLSNLFVTLTQITRPNQTNLFPFPFRVHLIFSLVAIFFFYAMFSKYKKPYQAIMGFAIPFSLVIWLSDSKTVFYTVGIVELILLAAALVLTILYKRKKASENAVAETAADEAADISSEDIAEETETSDETAPDDSTIPENDVPGDDEE